MKRFTICTLIFVLIAFSDVAYTQSKVLSPGTPEEGGFSAARLARLDSGINDWVKNKWVNGAVALIARHGKIVFDKAYGYNDPATKEPLDENGIFRIASQTKAITVTAVMMLWEEGKFSLEDPVSKYIPSFANEQVLDTFNPKDTTYTTVPAKRQVTIFDLLTHTSGIGYAGIGSKEANAIYAKYKITGGEGIKDQTLSGAMARLGSLPLLFQPGEKWMYGLNMDVLGDLVQIWSGMTLEEFFTKKIFQPLGMKDTYFNVPSNKASRLVNFFLQDSTGVFTKPEAVFNGALKMNYPLEHSDYFSGGGGLCSTIKDYAIFLQMLLNGGEYNGVRLLGPNTIRMMTMNQIGDLHPNIGANADINGFGFGFFIVSKNGSRLTPSQAGTYAWGGVFSTSYQVDPKEDMIVLLYQQMWGPHVVDADKQFIPLVYQALNN